MDPYQVLGLSRSASESEIKKAHRKLSRSCHPDVSDSPDAVEQFHNITTAKELLLDSEKRQLYDHGGWALVERASEMERMRENHVPQCEKIVIKKVVTLSQLYNMDSINVSTKVLLYGEDGTTEEEDFDKDIKLTGQECRFCIQGAGTDKPDHVRGDIEVHIELAPGPFQIRRSDIIYTCDLKLNELIGGYDRVIQHPDGKNYRVTGTYHPSDDDDQGEGEIRIFQGLGMPVQKNYRMAGPTNGDLVVLLKPDIASITTLPDDVRGAILTILDHTLDSDTTKPDGPIMCIDSLSKTPEEMSRAQRSAMQGMQGMQAMMQGMHGGMPGMQMGPGIQIDMGQGGGPGECPVS